MPSISSGSIWKSWIPMIAIHTLWAHAALIPDHSTWGRKYDCDYRSVRAPAVAMLRCMLSLLKLICQLLTSQSLTRKSFRVWGPSLEFLPTYLTSPKIEALSHFWICQRTAELTYRREPSVHNYTKREATWSHQKVLDSDRILSLQANQCLHLISISYVPI